MREIGTPKICSHTTNSHTKDYCKLERPFLNRIYAKLQIKRPHIMRAACNTSLRNLGLISFFWVTHKWRNAMLDVLRPTLFNCRAFYTFTNTFFLTKGHLNISKHLLVSKKFWVDQNNKCILFLII